MSKISEFELKFEGALANDKCPYCGSGLVDGSCTKDKIFFGKKRIAQAKNELKRVRRT
jgi:hypothetical protein